MIETCNPGHSYGIRSAEWNITGFMSSVQCPLTTKLRWADGQSIAGAVFKQRLLSAIPYIVLCGSVKRFSPLVRFGRSRSSKVIDSDTNWKRVCNFLLVVVVTLLLSCTVSEILQVSALMTRPLFHPNFEGVPVGPDCRCWVSLIRYLKISAVKLFSKYSNLREKHTWTSQKDRRMDRRLTVT